MTKGEQVGGKASLCAHVWPEWHTYKAPVALFGDASDMPEFVMVRRARECSKCGILQDEVTYDEA